MEKLSTLYLFHNSFLGHEIAFSNFLLPVLFSPVCNLSDMHKMILSAQNEIQLYHHQKIHEDASNDDESHHRSITGRGFPTPWGGGKCSPIDLVQYKTVALKYFQCWARNIGKSSLHATEGSTCKLKKSVAFQNLRSYAYHISLTGCLRYSIKSQPWRGGAHSREVLIGRVPI